ncbi:hypothetical protein QYS47_18140 [Marivirga arenosa]|uniref:Uncharacterized protein n=1 Tax=Marivirga arenosa TaxID=3059076 RepID=A0AA49GI65_9BACT|nr:hypothetical protein QYS47_18140 [Marivirga sp. BKB1-2]
MRAKESKYDKGKIKLSRFINRLERIESEYKKSSQLMFPEAKKKDLPWLIKLREANPLITRKKLRILYLSGTITYLNGKFYFCPKWKKWEERFIGYSLTFLICSPIIAIYATKFLSLDFIPSISLVLISIFFFLLGYFLLIKVRPYFTTRKVEYLFYN